MVGADKVTFTLGKSANLDIEKMLFIRKPAECLAYGACV